MSKLKTFLTGINANELLGELAKNPATLDITNTPNNTVSHNNFKALLETLKGDGTVKNLKIDGFVCNSESLTNFVEFVTDPGCLITSIEFGGKILTDAHSVNLLTQAFCKNNTIKEITFSGSRVVGDNNSDSGSNLGDVELSALLENLSKENIESLSFSQTKIKLETKEVRNKFIDFLTKSNIKNLALLNTDITQESKIELLKVIQTINLNNSDIDIFCEVIKHSKINELGFSLGREISDKSKEKLLTSIKSNKSLINCSVTGPNDMSPQEKKEKKEWISVKFMRELIKIRVF